jgi:hypothetical protein
MMSEWPDLARLFARVRPLLQNQKSQRNDDLLALMQNIESSMTTYMRKNTGYHGNSSVQNHNYVHPYLPPPSRPNGKSNFVFASSIATQENV